jgi:hypothetical protein
VLSPMDTPGLGERTNTVHRLGESNEKRNQRTGLGDTDMASSKTTTKYGRTTAIAVSSHPRPIGLPVV